MDTKVWVPLLVALIGAIFVIVNTTVSRATARDIARLAAQQKRCDNDLEVLGTYGESLVSASLAVQMFVWYGEDTVLSKTDVTRSDWVSARTEIEQAARSIELLKYSFGGLPDHGPDWARVRDSHSAVVDLLQRVVRIDHSGVEETRHGRDIWNDAAGPDGPIMSAIKATNDLKRDILRNYPIDVPDSLGIASRVSAALHPSQHKQTPMPSHSASGSSGARVIG